MSSREKRKVAVRAKVTSAQKTASARRGTVSVADKEPEEISIPQRKSRRAAVKNAVAVKVSVPAKKKISKKVSAAAEQPSVPVKKAKAAPSKTKTVRPAKKIIKEDVSASEVIKKKKVVKEKEVATPARRKVAAEVKVSKSAVKKSADPVAEKKQPVKKKAVQSEEKKVHLTAVEKLKIIQETRRRKRYERLAAEAEKATRSRKAAPKTTTKTAKPKTASKTTRSRKA